MIYEIFWIKNKGEINLPSIFIINKKEHIHNVMNVF